MQLYASKDVSSRPVEPPPNGRRCLWRTTFWVRDVDATYDRAVKAGGVSLHGAKEMEYDERACAVRDPCGNNWYIATHTGQS